MNGVSLVLPPIQPALCVRQSKLTFLLLRWMSPMLLASEFGPSSVEVLWGQSTVTSVCSPIRTLRTLSAPVTRIRGRPRRWVLNTLPYFCLRDAWKLEPWTKRTWVLFKLLHQTFNLKKKNIKENCWKSHFSSNKDWYLTKPSSF